MEIFTSIVHNLDVKEVSHKQLFFIKISFSLFVFISAGYVKKNLDIKKRNSFFIISFHFGKICKIDFPNRSCIRTNFYSQTGIHYPLIRKIRKNDLKYKICACSKFLVEQRISKSHKFDESWNAFTCLFIYKHRSEQPSKNLGKSQIED